MGAPVPHRGAVFRLGFSCFGNRLTAIRYALGLTVAARQDIAYARTASPPS